MQSHCSTFSLASCHSILVSCPLPGLEVKVRWEARQSYLIWLRRSCCAFSCLCASCTRPSMVKLAQSWAQWTPSTAMLRLPVQSRLHTEQIRKRKINEGGGGRGSHSQHPSFNYDILQHITKKFFTSIFKHLKHRRWCQLIMALIVLSMYTVK